MMVYEPDGLPEGELEWVKSQLSIANKKLAAERLRADRAERDALRSGVEALGLRRQIASLEEQLAWAEQPESAA